MPDCVRVLSNKLYRRNLFVVRKKQMMNETNNKGEYNETQDKWNLYRVYNYHLSEFSEKRFPAGFVDYHEFLFDVLENELHKTPMNLHNRNVFIHMLEVLRGSIIGALKKDCLMRGQRTKNDELVDNE